MTIEHLAAQASIVTDAMVEAVGFAMWREEAMRAAPNVGKNRVMAGYLDLLPDEKAAWDSLATAALAAMQAQMAPLTRAAQPDAEGGMYSPVWYANRLAEQSAQLARAEKSIKTLLHTFVIPDEEGWSEVKEARTLLAELDTHHANQV
jgi:hypothetical protein